MIRRYKLNLIIRFLFTSLALASCADDADSGYAPCDQPPELTVVNRSSYVIDALYLHRTVDYTGSTSILEAPMDPSIPESMTFTIEMTDGDTRHITFIRKDSMGEDIAVTTFTPIEFIECVKYKLNILELDFFLETSDNYYNEVDPDAESYLLPDDRIKKEYNSVTCSPVSTRQPHED